MEMGRSEDIILRMKFSNYKQRDDNPMNDLKNYLWIDADVEQGNDGGTRQSLRPKFHMPRRWVDAWMRGCAANAAGLRAS
jgi:hypothetical protein